MTGPQVVEASGLAPSGSAWAQAVVAGGFIFVSGQVAWDEQGQIVGRGSVGEQAEQVFRNVERAVEAAGSTMASLVRVCVYLTDLEHVAAFRAVRDRRLVGVRPASTLVIVSSLVDLVEMTAVAVLE